MIDYFQASSGWDKKLLYKWLKTKQNKQTEKPIDSEHLCPYKQHENITLNVFAMCLFSLFTFL